MKKTNKIFWKFLLFCFSITIIISSIGGSCKAPESPPIPKAKIVSLTVLPDTVAPGAIATVQAKVEKDSKPLTGARVIFTSTWGYWFTNQLDSTLTQITAVSNIDGIAEALLRHPGGNLPYKGIKAQITASVEDDIRSASILFTSEADYSVPGNPASLTVLSVNPPAISVLEAGGDYEISEITFIVLDIKGRPVDSVNVNFTKDIGPTGSEVYPSSAITNQFGKVRCYVKSGTESGTVKLLAEAHDTHSTPPVWSVRSNAIYVAIHGGLLHPDRFTIGASPLNLAGYIYNGMESKITAQLSDRYGNPVPDSTIVHFRAYQSGLVEGSGLTNNIGFTTVSFFTGNPRPEPRTTNPFAKIYAFTQTKFNGVQLTVVDSTKILYSSHTLVNIFPDTTDTYCTGCSAREPFDIPNGASLRFRIEVHDIYYHPIMGGSTVSITVDGEGGELVGESNFEIPDTNIITPTYRPGVTLFFVRLADAKPESVSVIGNTVGVNAKVRSKYNGNASDVSFGKVH